MKAIRVHEFGPPEVMRLEEMPDPKPGDGTVVVRVRAAGVNPVDTYLRSGSYPPQRLPKLPYTPGMDAAGEVVSVGRGVAEVKAGDRVYVAGSLSGTYAEQLLALEKQVHPLPKQLSFSQGAAIFTPYATAYHALFHLARGQAGETVLVHGASGGVGTAAVQWARAAGMTVIGTAGTEKGKKLVMENGAHHVLDHNEPDYLDQLMKLTGGAGVNVILEMLANKNLGKDLTVLANKGRVMVIGSRGPVEINMRDAMNRDAWIHGVAIFSSSEPEMRGIHAALLASMENGTVRPVVGQEIPLAEASRAHQAVLQPGSYGKIVLVP